MERSADRLRQCVWQLFFSCRRDKIVHFLGRKMRARVVSHRHRCESPVTKKSISVVHPIENHKNRPVDAVAQHRLLSAWTDGRLVSAKHRMSQLASPCRANQGASPLSSVSTRSRVALSAI